VNEEGGARYHVAALAKGLAVIQTFGRESGRLTLSQVAERSGLTRPGARRYLLTLRDLGFVASDGREFYLAPKCLALGYAYLSSVPLWHFAQPLLEQLVEEVKETCSVTVLDGGDVLFVQRIPLQRMLSFGVTTGSRLPAYCTSMGRVLLGGLSDAQLAAYLAEVRPKKFTPRTVTGVRSLQRIVERDRERGYSIVSGELEERLTGISVPILDRNGATLAALNASVLRPLKSESELVRLMLPRLRRTAGKMSASVDAHARASS